MKRGKKQSLHLNPAVFSLIRTIHIYLTMFGLFLMLGFAVTGFSLNHKNWFGANEPLVTESEGRTPVELIKKSDALRVVEHLRQNLHVTGALGKYEDLEDRISLDFKSPGESWEIDVDKLSGKTMLHHEAYNSLAIMNHLHRGKNAGTAWSVLIDVSAFLIVLACLTGTILWLTLPKRRPLGLLAMLLGAGATLALVAWFVPGRDIKPAARVIAPDRVPEIAKTAPTTGP